ncbi:PilW family protein [Thauera linaloolentis]|uniref:PilW family protein n=1 Tax=Thauera linaloolentis TaxID=76112 RepID=UPI00031F1324|nr:PilW family protein [Thauera linaloolentis]MCM8565921.1 PilW family protein [Thauera linaloolentis]
MNRPVQKKSRFDRGFTLVEIMVGMVVGLLALLVVMQVFGSFEGQKRITTGTADTQTNGALALQGVLRETQLAGYGFALFHRGANLLNCTTSLNGSTVAGGFSTVPVVIANGDGAASDAITVRYGRSMSGGIATQVTRRDGDVLSVNSNLGCRVGDTLIMSNGGDTCYLLTVEDLPVPAINTTEITLDADGYSDLDPQPPSGSLPTPGDSPWLASCLGEYREVTFSVADDRLLRNGQEIASGIVGLQAQYGISDSAGDSAIQQWVDATGDWASLGNTDRRKRIKAVRVAIVARSPLRDPDPVSQACNQAIDPPTGVCAWKDESVGGFDSPAPVIDLSSADDWDHYRYRVFETIIPLRNVVWAKGAM